MTLFNQTSIGNQESESKTYSSEAVVTDFDFSGNISDSVQPIPDFLLPKALENDVVKKSPKEKNEIKAVEKPVSQKELPSERKLTEKAINLPNIKMPLWLRLSLRLFLILLIGWLAIINFSKWISPIIQGLGLFQPNVAFGTPTEEASATLVPTPLFTDIPAATSTPKLEPTSLPTEITDAKGVSMVLVPAGEFLMGSEFYDDTSPPHNVLLEDYYIDVYEVTNVLYRDCEEVGVCEPPIQLISNMHSSYYRNDSLDNYPVIYVTWEQAKLYCEKWRGAHLPSEAEWEKAARGPESNFYPWSWSNEDNPNESLVNFDTRVGDTTAVGSYEAGKSVYGLYDMAGNVWEWTEDWYDAYLGNTIPNSLYGTSHRVARGGSWTDFVVHSDRRQPYNPKGGYPTVGFRCAKDAQ